VSAEATPTKPKTFPAKVRTTVTPLEVVTVTEREWNDLASQGLIFVGTAAEAKAATTGGEPATDPTSPDEDDEKKGE
jgi:hypothetical protein